MNGNDSNQYRIKEKEITGLIPNYVNNTSMITDPVMSVKPIEPPRYIIRKDVGNICARLNIFFLYVGVVIALLSESVSGLWLRDTD
jgi:hypothetical protein